GRARAGRVLLAPLRRRRVVVALEQLLEPVRPGVFLAALLRRRALERAVAPGVAALDAARIDRRQIVGPAARVDEQPRVERGVARDLDGRRRRLRRLADVVERRELDDLFVDERVDQVADRRRLRLMALLLAQARLHELLDVTRGDLEPLREEELRQDRKSTRLNSSHVAISYAVF